MDADGVGSTGILQRRVVRYRYADAKGHARTGYLAPFRLAMYRHGLYVVGARLKAPDGDVRGATLGVFAIERFVEAEYLKRHAFEIPEDSRLSDVLVGSFGPHLPDATGPHEVVVEFSAEKAHLVSSREWHPSQTVTALNDGRVRIAFVASTCHRSCRGCSNGDRTRAPSRRLRSSCNSRASLTTLAHSASRGLVELICPSGARRQQQQDRRRTHRGP